uniref:Uncharacterized protein n=1 Tax=Lepeophtheirus salmonis TaxID=72036 RepID=A0A0K2U8Y6_LEPSM
MSFGNQSLRRTNFASLS